MSRPTDPTHPRNVWRTTQQLARFADVVSPRWWNRDSDVEILSRGRTPVEARCWRQLVRQRRGD